MRFAKTLIFIGLFSTAILKAQFHVSATVDHIIPWSTDTAGNIVHSVSGGTTPYSYTWAPGSLYTKDLTNAPANSYSFVANESGGGTITKSYNLGYKTRWFNHYGTFFRNDTLFSDGAAGYSNRCALSKNTLPAYTDGWLEYINKAATSAFVIGFLDSASLASRSDGSDYDFSFHVNNGYLYAYVQGSFYWLGYSVDGDVYTIERAGSVYNLKVNSVITFSSTAPANRRLKVKGQLYSDPLANIGVSFVDSSSIERLKIDNAYIDHLKTDDIDSTGSIFPSVTGGQLPYQVTWNSQNLSSVNLIEGQPNFYQLKVKDANNDSIIKNYRLGYKINWTDIYGSGASFVHDTLHADAATSSTGLSSAVSINELRPGKDGWLQHVVQDFVSPFVVGFCDSIIPSYQGTINDMNVAFHESTGSNLYAWYAGYWTWLGTGQRGDVLTLSRGGNYYYIKKNNDTLFTATADSTKNLRAKATINDNYFLANIGVSFADSTSANSLSVYGRVDHLPINESRYTGNIYPVISGGKTPYTYTWTPGSNSHSAQGIAPGTYTFKVKDARGDSLTYTYDLKYKTNWMSRYGTAFRNDSLYSDGSIAGNNTAISTNELPENTDGWAEFVVPFFYYPYLVGFLDSAMVDYVNTHDDVDFAFHQSWGNNLYAWSNGYFSWLGTVSAGDVIKIERTSGRFYLKQNGTAIHSATAPTNKKFRIKALLDDQPLVNIGCSFKLDAIIDKEHVDLTNNNCSGSATVTPIDGTAPYSVLWLSNDGSTDSISYPFRTDICQGSYTVSVVDSTGDQVYKVINLGVKPHWQYKRNINVSTDSIWVNRTDSLGISVSDDFIDKGTETWYEGKIKNSIHDYAIGFIGLRDTVGMNYPTAFGDSTWLSKIHKAYDLMSLAVNRRLPTSGTDSILTLDSSYNSIHLVRIFNGRAKSLMRNSRYRPEYHYSNGDVLKIGRNSSNLVYFAINERIVQRSDINIQKEFLYPILLVKDPVSAEKQGVMASPPVNLILPDNIYAKLKKKIDGGYYTVNGGKLFFVTEGEYNKTNLIFNIYNKSHNVVLSNSGSPSINSYYQFLGDNRYVLSNLSSLGPGYFILEVINEKQEKTYLRFRIPNNGTY